MNASERLPEGSPKGGRSPILKFREALKDTLRLMLLDCFQQLFKINQRFPNKVCLSARSLRFHYSIARELSMNVACALRFVLCCALAATRIASAVLRLARGQGQRQAEP